MGNDDALARTAKDKDVCCLETFDGRQYVVNQHEAKCRLWGIGKVPPWREVNWSVVNMVNTKLRLEPLNLGQPITQLLLFFGRGTHAFNAK